MPLTSPGNDDDTGENHQPTLRKNTAEPVEQTLKQNTETIIPSIAHDIKTIRDRRREVGRQVEKLLEDHPLLTVLTSMPGIGVRTASNILLGIGGDIANFKSSAHLAAYAGISPVTGQSGTSIKGERPSRRGNKRLKNALWQTAFVASTKHPPSVAYYKRKREQGKHHKPPSSASRVGAAT